MSDTASRSPVCAAQLLADALLRNVSGTSARLRVAASSAGSTQSELGLLASSFSEVILSPVVLRKLQPSFNSGGTNTRELLVSATSVLAQIRALDISSAEALFAMALAVTVAGQEYLIESVAANEAFGQVYLYRVLLRESHTQSL